MNFGTGTHAMLHGTEQVVTAKEGESIAGMVSRAMRAGQSSPQMLRELRGLRQDVQRNTRETRKMASRMQTSIGYAVARANAA